MLVLRFAGADRFLGWRSGGMPKGEGTWNTRSGITSDISVVEFSRPGRLDLANFSRCTMQDWDGKMGG